ncbi:hypothetical protein VTP01DRAFT_8873 [Rhizomucor pusillus]|uniref:uncharacterized protein n=1 Tax=Rhizomucor pusillus TaxID=4840 RepID=UPI0037426B6D
MVKSSIVVPTPASTSSSRKRSIDQDGNERKSVNDSQPEPTEVKKPRLDMNPDSRKRGQRLFGVLLGTLNKFKDDSEQKSEAERKRQEIDLKLHEKLANEKKELEQEIQQEEEQRQQEKALLKRMESRTLEAKRDLTSTRTKEHLANFLKTNTEPRLLYRPAQLSDEQSKIIQEQKDNAQKERQAYEKRQEEREQQQKLDEQEAAKYEKNDKTPEQENPQSHHQQQQQPDDEARVPTLEATGQDEPAVAD